MGYTLGETVALSIAWTLQKTGVPYDPVSCTLRLEKPDQSVQVLSGATAPPVVRDGLGLYHTDVIVDQPGWWYYRWEALGDDPGAVEDKFFVDESRFL